MIRSKLFLAVHVHVLVAPVLFEIPLPLQLKAPANPLGFEWLECFSVGFELANQCTRLEEHNKDKAFQQRQSFSYCWYLLVKS
jgi:hypothetical protein